MFKARRLASEAAAELPVLNHTAAASKILACSFPAIFDNADGVTGSVGRVSANNKDTLLRLLQNSPFEVN